MIWHIFKKDWKLLWQWVVAAALLNAIQRILLMSAGEPSPFSPVPYIASMLGAMNLLVLIVLAVIVVQNDALSGLRQDWLVRPIGRRDLLLSKMLFIALLIQGPIFLFEVVQGLATGFSLRESLMAAGSHGLWMLLALDLPAITFGTLTRNLPEAIGAGTVAFLGVAIFGTLNQIRAAGMGMMNDLLGTAIGWVTESAQLTGVLLAVTAILALQYFRRKTTVARWTFCCATILVFIAGMLPWQSAFAIQEWFSPRPSAANPVRVAFEASLGKYRRRPGEYDPRRYVGGVAAADVVANVPLGVNGVGDGQSLAIDRLTARLTEPGGNVVEIVSASQPGSPTWEAHQPMWIPEDVYNRIKDQPSRLEIDYSLTLLKASPVQTMPALDGDRRLPDLGRCVTRTVAGDTQIELHCVRPGQPPCTTAFLENPRTGKRANANNPGCGLNYSPYYSGHIFGDSMNRFHADFFFRDPSGQIQYPVDESQLKDARVVIQVYQPLAHFTRQVVIPDIRLSDWRPE